MEVKEVDRVTQAWSRIQELIGCTLVFASEVKESHPITSVSAFGFGIFLVIDLRLMLTIMPIS